MRPVRLRNYIFYLLALTITLPPAGVELLSVPDD